jgi:hypothetical protein
MQEMNDYFGTHTFTNSCDGKTITVTMCGESTLASLIDAFESYLKASGYVLPENSYLDFVSNAEPDLAYDPTSDTFFEKVNK